MLRCIAFTLLLAVATMPASAQSRDGQPAVWAQDEGRIVNSAARISFPVRAEGLELREETEFSRQGEGLDTVLQYWTDDRQVFGTAYVYYSGLPHAGLTAYMTDRVIGMQAADGFRRLGTGLAGAGGHDGVAIRSDYAGFRDGLSTSAAFIKAGRWIVKLRVSGPADRQNEVQRAMTELLARIRFEGDAQPRAATPLTVRPCPAGGEARDARLLPDPEISQIAAQAIVATFDGGGMRAEREGGGHADLEPRVPREFCSSEEIELGGGTVVQVLRARDGPALGVEGRTVLLVPITDSGRTLELVHAERLGGYLLLFHQIGSTTVLARFDAVPTDRQVAEMLRTADHPALRARAIVELLPNGNTDVQVIAPPDPPAASTT